MKCKFIIFFFVFILCDYVSVAQLIELPDSMPPQSVILQTDRFLSTQLTIGSIDYTYQNFLTDGRLRANFISTTTLVNSTTKDQIDILWSNKFVNQNSILEQKHPNKLLLISGFEGTLSNEKSNANFTKILGLNNSYNLFGGFGGEFNNDNYFKNRNLNKESEGEDSTKVSLLVGIASNRQLNNVSTGAGVASDIKIRTNIDDYKINFNSKARAYNLSPKLNTFVTMYLDAENEFFKGDKLNFNFLFEHFGNDIFVKRKEEDILKYGGLEYEAMLHRVENRSGASFDVKFLASENWQINGLGAINKKQYSQNETSERLPPLQRDTDPFRLNRNDLNISFSISQNIFFENFRISNSFLFFDNNQINLVEALRDVTDFEYNLKKETFHNSDFVSKSLTISNEVEFMPSFKDTVLFNGSYTVFRYDTPAEKNKLDKDELLINAAINYSRNHSKYIDFKLSLQYYYTHLVYLFKEFSNENHRNHVLRFTQNINYNVSEIFNNYFSSDITANYTEYDYKTILQSERGRSFRELHLNDSMLIRLISRLYVHCSGDYRYSLRGIFNFDKFTESPLEVSKSVTNEITLKVKTQNNWEFECGNRLIFLDEMRKDARGGMSLISGFASIGPIGKIIFNLSNSSQVIFTGWLENRYSNKVFINTQPWLNLAVNYKL